MADLDAVAAASGSIEAELRARILGSETLRRSGRLKELLAWLLERSAEAPHLPIREHDIGTVHPVNSETLEMMRLAECC